MESKELTIGIIADIHGNIEALRTCTEEMRKRGCTEFWFLGDYVSDTAGARETLDFLYRLRERFPCRFLRGNREEYFLRYRDSREGEENGVRWLPNSASGNLLYTYRCLTEEDFDFFRELPICFRVEKEGYPSVTCCHGSPEASGELLELTGERVRQVLKGLDTDFLIAAHTHRQGILHAEGKCCINTGSCGLAIGAPGYLHAVLLHGQNGEFSPELLKLPYNVNETIRRIFTSGLFDMAPWFMNNNIHTLLYGIDVTAEFVGLAKKLESGRRKAPAVWPSISEESFRDAAEHLGIPDYSYVRYFRKACPKDREKLADFYRSLYGGPAGWHEGYPGPETIEFDLRRDALFLLEEPENGILASISLDLDRVVEGLPFWDPELAPVGELSRIGVRRELWGKGLARVLLALMFTELRSRGYAACHLLVCEEHSAALHCYLRFSFKRAGKCELYGHSYLALEMKI